MCNAQAYDAPASPLWLPIPQEAALVTRAQVLLRPAAEAAIEHACAALVLALRLLSGRHAITSALVATALWLGMVMSELRIMGQVRARDCKGGIEGP